MRSGPYPITLITTRIYRLLGDACNVNGLGSSVDGERRRSDGFGQCCSDSVSDLFCPSDRLFLMSIFTLSSSVPSE